jgi:hypothetical protein
MRIFVEGRHGLPGLAARGFDCAIFDGGSGSLRDRIDQCFQFIAGWRASAPRGEDVALFGYSAGGLVARGLVRAHRDLRAGAIFQLAAPNAGIVTDDAGGLLRRIHFDRSVIEDLDMESAFMTWLNGTSGHWEPEPHGRGRRWKLDKKPWVIDDGVPILNLVGRVPRYRNQSDGVVVVESATLGDALPHAFIDGKGANHLNLSGAWNALTLCLRGWRSDDRLWPQAVEAAAGFFAAAARG